MTSLPNRRSRGSRRHYKRRTEGTMPRKKKERDAELKTPQEAATPEPVAEEGAPTEEPPAAAEEEALPQAEVEPVEDAAAPEPVAEESAPEEAPPEAEVEPVEDAAAPVPVEAVAGGPGPEAGAAPDPERRKRRRLLVGLSVLGVLLIVAGVTFARYLLNPGPLPDLLPLPLALNYRPHYLFSIYGVEQPSGVAVSLDGKRIYVTESGGEREVKVFDRDGGLLGSFAPPYTEPAERVPVYVAVDPAGRVFVTDRLQRAVFVYDRDGRLLDAILGPDLTLSEYVSRHLGGVPPDRLLAYNLFAGAVYVRKEGEAAQIVAAPDPAGWAPLGVRIDEKGALLLTNVAEGQHTVREYSAELVLAATWEEFDPPGFVFGVQGYGNEELMFPNSAVADSQGRIYVTDGNNGRVSVWNSMGDFLFTFGRGVGESALSLPRGAAMDGRDRLHVADAVQQAVKVYDVSGLEPEFRYAFGDWGTEEGQFNYPSDIALDSTGRLYVADRENNRVQVWSY